MWEHLHKNIFACWHRCVSHCRHNHRIPCFLMLYLYILFWCRRTIVYDRMDINKKNHFFFESCVCFLFDKEIYDKNQGCQIFRNIFKLLEIWDNELDNQCWNLVGYTNTFLIHFISLPGWEVVGRLWMVWTLNLSRRWVLLLFSLLLQASIVLVQNLSPTQCQECKNMT